MKHIFTIFLALLLTTCLLPACSSDKKEDPQPPTGTVVGQITPATAITTVTAIDSLNRAVTATPTATGEYTLKLIAGYHTLRFTPATGYTAPPEQRIEVSAGGFTIPDPTKVTRDGGTATLSVDNTAVAVTLVRADFSFGDLTLTLLTATGQTAELQISPYREAARTGTFAGFSDARLFYTDATGAQWGAPTTGTPTGAFAVTPMGTNPVRVSGSFSCTLQAKVGGATGTRAVSGTFTNVAY